MTYWIATLPSIEPSANPSAPGNTAIVLVCHFNGEVTVYQEGYKKESAINQALNTAHGKMEGSNTDFIGGCWV